MSEYIVDTFGIVQDFADLHGDMNTPLYEAIMDVMASRQREEIVRCRDCASFREKDWRCTAFQWRNCDGSPDVEPDGFCSWAKRKEEQ